VLLDTYEEARLLWEAKGWTLEGVASELKEAKDFPDDLRLSGPTLQRHSVNAKPLPSPIAKVVEGLKPFASYKRQAEIVEMGLRFLKGLPVQSAPQEVARELLAHFPADEVAQRLAEALTNHVTPSPTPSNPLLQAFAQAIAQQLPRVRQLRVTKVARAVTALLRHELERLIAKRLATAGAVGGFVGGVVACGTLLLVLGGRVPLRFTGHVPTWAVAPDQAVQAPAVTNTAQPLIIVASLSQGVLPVAFDLRAFLGAIASGQLGRKVPVEQYIPDKPLPGQKLPPCTSGLKELAIKGGCWTQIQSSPPCEMLFRYENGCYRPIAADLTKPVGLVPEGPE